MSRGYPYLPKSLPPKLKKYQFKTSEYSDESCTKLIGVRIPESLKKRLDEFKEQNGRMPHREIRAFLDTILPELQIENENNNQPPYGNRAKLNELLPEKANNASVG